MTCTAASAKSLPALPQAEPQLALGAEAFAAEAAAEVAKSAAEAVLEAALEAAWLHAKAREAGGRWTAKSWPEIEVHRYIPILGLTLGAQRRASCSTPHSMR